MHTIDISGAPKGSGAYFKLSSLLTTTLGGTSEWSYDKGTKVFTFYPSPDQAAALAGKLESLDGVTLEGKSSALPVEPEPAPPAAPTPAPAPVPKPEPAPPAQEPEIPLPMGMQHIVKHMRIYNGDAHADAYIARWRKRKMKKRH